LGTLLVLLENFQFIEFNEVVWICGSSMAFVKNIEFEFFFVQNSIKLQHVVLEGKNG
jgi:hypothetical protein